MTSAPKVSAPPCRKMGGQCDSLRVLLRVATLENGPNSADHEATWLLGHTERLTFLGELERGGNDLFVEAVRHVPCRLLRARRREGEKAKGREGEKAKGREGEKAKGREGEQANGSMCTAHGYSRKQGPRGPDPAEARQL